MEIKEAEERVASAPVGNRSTSLIQAAVRHRTDDERALLRRAARRNGLGKHEIDAAFAVADRR